MLDDMFDYIETIRERPVWQPIPAAVRGAFQEPFPTGPTALAVAHAKFMETVLPYAVGNVHPRFMGWVHGGGTAVGMVAEMLAAGLNANLAGRDQMPLAVERQIVTWMRDLFGLPPTAGGLFVTGSSTANLVGVLVARTRAMGIASKATGVAKDRRHVGYAASTAHGCIADAMSIAGLGSDALRRVPVDDQHRMDVTCLSRMIESDREAGLVPFFIAASAGTVDVGAVDDLTAVAEVAEKNGLWFHVDGALGALAMMSPDIAPLLRGIERADSIALDFHKWGQVPYDAGFVIVRDQAEQLSTFATPADYLARHPRGLAAGSPWPCDLGPDLSRGFRALKTWFTLVVHGSDQLGAAISRSCQLARRLAARINARPELELLAPVALNIVCFRYRCDHSDPMNAEIVADLQESGVAVASTTRVNGRLAIRVAIVNHRTNAADIDAFVDATCELGARRAHSGAAEAGGKDAARPNTSHQGGSIEGLGRLMTLAFDGTLLAPLAARLLQRAERDETDAGALMDLSVVLQLQGLRDLGMATQLQALATRRLYEVRPAIQPRIRLLAITAPGDIMTNTPLEFLIAGSDVSLSMLYVAPGEPIPSDLPAHDAIFIAVAYSEVALPILRALEATAPCWTSSVINQPGRIPRTARTEAFKVLAGSPGIYIPATARASRAELLAVATGRSTLGAVLGDPAFPLIVRPIDSHAGHGLERIDAPQGIVAYLDGAAADEFFVSRFIDYRNHDGMFRKYRVVLIDGVAYPGHMGISADWMIHYLNAGMAESAAKRSEEERFMNNFRTGFGARHASALKAIATRFALDYLVIDCGEMSNGELLVFEVCTGAVVHAMDPIDLFPYKRPHMEAIFSAFGSLVRRSMAANLEVA
jgi:aromatic-L-amino-acid/L-tryptophan decarboxylase